MTAFLHALTKRRLVRFVTVGVAAAAILFVLSWLLVSFGLSPFTGSLAAYIVAFAFAYTAQHGWTFEARHDHGHALPRYLAVQAGCAVLSGLVSYVAVGTFDMAPLAMSALTTLAASAASYVLSSLWVFPARG